MAKAKKTPAKGLKTIADKSAAATEEFGYSVKYINEKGYPTNVQLRGENAEQDAKDLIAKHGNGSLIKIKF